MRGFEPAALGGREAHVGEDEPAEILERGARSREALLEPRGERTDLALRRSHDRERIFEQRATRLVARARAERTHEREGLAALEAVAFDGRDDRLLGRTRDAAERERQRDADRPRVDARGDRRLERARERESARDPLHAPTAERRDPARAEPLLDAERVDDARLVHGRERPRRRVRPEEQDARLGPRPRRLDDDRDLAQPLGSPALEPFESVCHLVAPVRERHDAEREIGEVVLAPSATAPQDREPRLELLDRNVPDASAFEESWFHTHSSRSADDAARA